MSLIKVTLPARMKVMCFERDTTNKLYRAWIHTADFVNGTYLELHDDGLITRVTIRPHDPDDVVVIKPRDKEC